MGEEKRLSGVVEKVVAWKTGKGYFLDVQGKATKFYGFGAPRCKARDEVALTVKPGSGAFSEKWEITVCAMKKAAEPAPLDDEEPALGAEEEWDEQEPQQAAKPAEQKPKVPTPREYRDYQHELMKECFDEAAQMVPAGDAATKDVALAFFDKRCTPLHFFLGGA